MYGKAASFLAGLYFFAILWVGRYPVRDFTMYIHRRAEQRSGKLMTNYD